MSVLLKNGQQGDALVSGCLIRDSDIHAYCCFFIPKNKERAFDTVPRVG